MIRCASGLDVVDHVLKPLPRRAIETLAQVFENQKGLAGTDGAEGRADGDHGTAAEWSVVAATKHCSQALRIARFQQLDEEPLRLHTRLDLAVRVVDERFVNVGYEGLELWLVRRPSKDLEENYVYK